MIISTKLGHNVWNRKILKEFNYECYRDRIVRVICPLFKKTVTLDFVYILSSAYMQMSQHQTWAKYVCPTEFE